LRFTEEVLERRSQRGGIDTHCDNRALLGGSTLDFPADVRGGDGAFGQYQNEGLGAADRANDRVRVERSGFYIARRDPAPDSVSLQGRDQGTSDGRVLRRVAERDMGG